MKLIKFSALILVIGRIKINPEFWEGQTVTIMDEYRGWETVYGPPPVSKSDWVIKDESGACYVTGNSKGLRYPDDLKKIVTITGVVRLTEKGDIYIEIPRGRPTPASPTPPPP